MHIMKLAISLFCLMALAITTPMKSSAQKRDEAQKDPPSASLKWKINRSGELKYLYYLPKDYNPKGKERWPLMLFLHGAGERGTEVQRVAIHGPMSLVKQGKDFPFIIIAPQCPS